MNKTFNDAEKTALLEKYDAMLIEIAAKQ